MQTSGRIKYLSNVYLSWKCFKIIIELSGSGSIVVIQYEQPISYSLLLLGGFLSWGKVSES